MGKENCCPICGEPTYLVYGKYPRKDGLCHKHSQMLFNKEIEQCPDCGEWHKTDETCKCKTVKEAIQHTSEPETEKEKPESDQTCIICGKHSDGKLQCKDCYKETLNYMDSLDKNNSTHEFRDYYYNLKERIVIINDIKEVQRQCNKLIAIAMLNQNVNDDSSLTDRAYKDVERLINNKKQLSKNIFADEREEKEQEKSRINTAQDGHNVASDMEVRIDDMVYKEFIIHRYGKNTIEIDEKRKKCDWFIPIVNSKGIYVEYWGMTTPKYLKERKEKEELYQKYNIPYISIEKDDPKQDTQIFTNNFLRELRKKAKEYFGFMPEWKK